MSRRESESAPNNQLFEELLAQLPLTESRSSSVGQGGDVQGDQGDHALHFMDEDQFSKFLFFEI